MSNNKMLIDAAHPEETRVVMVRGNRVDEFDFESEHKTQLRGNIYLAKVTRVEPSLQAAFVDYGGNRHGFLAFSEIHPDYYQIPIADRQALIAAEAEDARIAAAKEAAEDDDHHDDDDGDDGDSNDSVEAEADSKPARKRRSRRRGGKKTSAARNDNASDADSDEDDDSADSDNDADYDSVETINADGGSQTPGDKASGEESDDDETLMSADNDGDDVVSEPAGTNAGTSTGEEPAKKPRRRTSRKKVTEEPESSTAESAASPEASEEAPKPKRKRAPRKKPAAAEAAEADAATESNETGEQSPAKETSQDAEAASEDDKPKKTRRRTARAKKTDKAAAEKTETDESSAELANSADMESAVGDGEDDQSEDNDSRASGKEAKQGRGAKRSRRAKGKKKPEPKHDDDDQSPAAAQGVVEELGSDDALEEVPVRRTPRRNYKIQEVIKRRQILLVQVVKEERGNKGAALTTYLSLAGRYSVLMPNTARGGGISRKITNAADRKRLKSIATGLDVPQGMGVILRTAGASRDNQDIQRDFEYLMRLWETVRTLTLESTAPCLVYEEGSLIKRSIRDLYDGETGEVLVAGEAGYREAKDFMAMLMPNHANKVKLYQDRIPLFARMGVESQLDAMLQPQVTLKSGGYLIIDQTEALVAIDVNSGRSTRQHSIEDTAYQTNLEAADEVARQLRLRDLAGLIVIDFIDMEDKRNIRNVEKRLKDALKNDRARIQVGRISHFGLMEMSRQRIRASVLESTTQVCPVCEGLGHVRAASSVVLAVLRAIEEHLNRSARNDLHVKVSTPTALYLLNNKRDNLGDLEHRFGVSIIVETDDSMGTLPCTIEKGEPAGFNAVEEEQVQPDSVDVDMPEDEPVEREEVKAVEESRPRRNEPASGESADNGEDQGGGRKRRRRRRKRKGSGSGENSLQAESQSEDDSDAESDDDSAQTDQSDESLGDDGNRGEVDTPDSSPDEDQPAPKVEEETLAADPAQNASETPAPPAPVHDLEADAQEADEEDNGRPKRRNTKRRKDGTSAAPVEKVIAALSLGGSPVTETVSAEAEASDEKAPKKGGWWQRKFF